MKKKNNILIIKLGALGDFIQATGPMAAIREHHRDDHITLMTSKAFKSLGQKCGYFDDIFIDKRPSKLDVSGWLKLRKTLNNAQYDRIYDLQNNDRTSLYFKLLKNPKPEWIGVAKGASHRNTSPQRTAGHAFEGHCQTLALGGVHNIHVDTLNWLDEDISEFNLPDSYVVIVPGCSPQHPYKRWPASHYAALAQNVIDCGIDVVMLGTKAEKDTTDAIQAACPKVINLSERTSLFQIVTIGRGALCAIGNDTGPMHMIGPTGTPSLVLFSKYGNPKKHAPKGAFIKTIQQEDISDITVQDVFSVFEEMQSAKSQP